MEAKELAGHLRRPKGEDGIKVGDDMFAANGEFCRNTYERSQVGKGHQVLEIGFGNGKTIPYLFGFEPDIHYTGLDYSETMCAEARKNNKDRIDMGLVEIVHGEVSNLPFDSERFDRVCTVNTLYFWPDPVGDARELRRVTKKGGTITIGIRPRSSVERLDIAPYGFQLYEPEEAADLMREAGWADVSYELLDEGEVEFREEKYHLWSCFVYGRNPG